MGWGLAPGRGRHRREPNQTMKTTSNSRITKYSFQWRAPLLAAAMLLAINAPAQPWPKAGLMGPDPFRAHPGTAFGHSGVPAHNSQVVGAPAGHTRYALIPLDLPSGEPQISPTGLNNQGNIIGLACDLYWVYGVGLLWSGPEITVMPDLNSAFYRHPLCINQRNQVVGQDQLGTPNNTTYAGWFWEPGMKKSVHLTPVRDTDLWVSGSGINAAGEIVGLSGSALFVQSDAVLWKSCQARPTKLKGLDGFPMNDAFAINNHRELAGWSFHEAGSEYTEASALFWRGPEAAPEALPGLGGGYDIAATINDNHQIAGLSSTTEGSWHAVFWENGKVTDLAPQYSFSELWNPGQMNNRGQIVGLVVLDDGSWHAVLWETNGHQVQMLDLNQALAAPTSYVLYYGEGINDAGCIVADGYDSNDPAQSNRAFLLVPIP